MSFERMAAGAETAPAPHLGEATSTAGASPAMRLQILSTEHWSLLASRSLAWNESFSRASMFLTTLSGAIVALGLVGGASGFGEAFTLFALVILPVVFFLGLDLDPSRVVELPRGRVRHRHESHPRGLPRAGAGCRALLRHERS